MNYLVSTIADKEAFAQENCISNTSSIKFVTTKSIACESEDVAIQEATRLSRGNPNAEIGIFKLVKKVVPPAVSVVEISDVG